ncbi:MAG TPA: outer membrane beta-barrel protein [Longimicrobium sp.]|nr:outer membrane beta-barrel protein [Longimicrobium sp.]
MIHRVFLPAALATLLCALSAPALSQTEAPRRPQAQPRGYLDYFAAGVSRAYAGGDAGSGFGARLMVRVAPAGSTLGRVLVGGYASHLPRTGSGGDTWQYGSQADVHVRGPGSRFDPMLTLAAGAVRREGEWTWQVANRRSLRVFRDDARTGYTLSPGMAARAHVTRAVALRGDIRRAFALDGDARGGTEYAVGISLPF